MTTTADRITAPDRDKIRGLVLPTGIAAFVVSSVWTVLGAHNWKEYVSLIALALVVSVFVYGWVVPRGLRRESAPAPALTMAVLAAALLLPAFWSGLPLVLGAASALLGYAGRSAKRGAGASIAALLLGLLCMVGYLAVYVYDGLILGHM